MANPLGISGSAYAARIEFLKTGDAAKLASPTYAIGRDLYPVVDVGQLLGAMKQSMLPSITRMTETLEAMLDGSTIPPPEEKALAAVRDDYLCFTSMHYPDDKDRHAADNYLHVLATLSFRNPAN